MPTPRVQVDTNFNAQIKALQVQAADAVAPQTDGGQVRWARPDLNGWSGSPDDWDDMHRPFDRTDVNQNVVAATSDPADPGVSGDVVAGTSQAHYLGTLERALRARHTTRVRASAHAAARKKGHGDNRGPLVQCVLEFIRGVVAQSRGE